MSWKWIEADAPWWVARYIRSSVCYPGDGSWRTGMDITWKSFPMELYVEQKATTACTVSNKAIYGSTCTLSTRRIRLEKSVFSLFSSFIKWTRRVLSWCDIQAVTQREFFLFFSSFFKWTHVLSWTIEARVSYTAFLHILSFNGGYSFSLSVFTNWHAFFS